MFNDGVLMVGEELELDQLRGQLLLDIGKMLALLDDFRGRLEREAQSTSLYDAARVRILGTKFDMQCLQFMAIAQKLKAQREEQEPAIDVQEDELELDNIALKDNAAAE